MILKKLYYDNIITSKATQHDYTIYYSYIRQVAMTAGVTRPLDYCNGLLSWLVYSFNNRHSAISHFDSRQSCVLRGQYNRLHRMRSGVTFCKHVGKFRVLALKCIGFGYREKLRALVLPTVCTFHASPEHARRIDVFVLNFAILCFFDRRNCICSSRVITR